MPGLCGKARDAAGSEAGVGTGSGISGPYQKERPAAKQPGRLDDVS